MHGHHDAVVVRLQHAKDHMLASVSVLVLKAAYLDVVRLVLELRIVTRKVLDVAVLVCRVQACKTLCKRGARSIKSMNHG